MSSSTSLNSPRPSPAWETQLESLQSRLTTLESFIRTAEVDNKGYLEWLEQRLANLTYQVHQKHRYLSTGIKEMEKRIEDFKKEVIYNSQIQDANTRALNERLGLQGEEIAALRQHVATLMEVLADQQRVLSRLQIQDTVVGSH